MTSSPSQLPLAINDTSLPSWVPARLALTPAAKLRLKPDSLPTPRSGLVSVIIPTFNRRDTLPETLDSIWRQTYRPLEIILIDDGSTDGTIQFLQEHFFNQPEGDAIHLKFLSEIHQGAAAARNRGLLESHGEYIQYLDSDDTMDSTKIASHVRAARSSACSQIVYGPWLTRFTRLDGRVQQRGGLNLRPRHDPLTDYLQGRYVPVHGLLWPRAAAIAIGLWDESLRMNEDGDMFLRAAAAGWPFHYCPAGPVNYHRWESATHSASAQRTRAAYESQLAPLVRLQITLELQRRLDDYGELLARHYLRRAGSLAWLYPEIARDCLGLARAAAPHWGHFRKRGCGALLGVIQSALNLDKSGSLAWLFHHGHSRARRWRQFQSERHADFKVG